MLKKLSKFFFRNFSLSSVIMYVLISIMFQQKDWWEVVDEKLLSSCVNYQLKNAFLIFLLTYVNIVVKYLFMKRKNFFTVYSVRGTIFAKWFETEFRLFFCYVNITFHLLIVSKGFVTNLGFFCIAKWFETEFRLFSIMSKKCAKFLFRNDSKQNSGSFFCLATEFCFFLFRRNRRNFDETTVCFVLFHISRNNFLNQKCKGTKLILTILFLASTEVFRSFYPSFHVLLIQRNSNYWKLFPFSNAKKS